MPNNLPETADENEQETPDIKAPANQADSSASSSIQGGQINQNAPIMSQQIIRLDLPQYVSGLEGEALQPDCVRLIFDLN